jgi:hypothetical protein
MGIRPSGACCRRARGAGIRATTAPFSAAGIAGMPCASTPTRFLMPENDRYGNRRMPERESARLYRALLRGEVSAGAYVAQLRLEAHENVRRLLRDAR